MASRRTSRYRMFDPQFWTSKTIQSLSSLQPSAMGLLLFLLTCREGGFIPGVIFLGVAAVAEILGWEVEATRGALKELCDAGLVKADIKARLVYIVGAISTNQPDNPNIVLGWAVTWHEVPDCALKGDIHTELRSALVSRGPAFAEAFLQACPDGSGNGFANGLGNKELELETENEHDQENEPESRTSSSASASESPAGDIPVEQVVPAGHQSKSSASASASGNPPGLDDEDHPIRTSEPPRISKGKMEAAVSTEVEQVFSEWSKICASAESPFSEVSLSTRAKHTPTIIKCMEDPRWLPWCLAVIPWLPSSDFNAGRFPPREGKPPYVLAFGALINKVQILHEKMLTDVAKRERPAKARQGSDLPPAHQQGELLGNHYERMQAKKAAENRPSYDEELNDCKRAGEEAERLRRADEAVEDDEDYR